MARGMDEVGTDLEELQSENAKGGNSTTGTFTEEKGSQTSKIYIDIKWSDDGSETRKVHHVIEYEKVMSETPVIISSDEGNGGRPEPPEMGENETPEMGENETVIPSDGVPAGVKGKELQTTNSTDGNKIAGSRPITRSLTRSKNQEKNRASQGRVALKRKASGTNDGKKVTLKQREPQKPKIGKPKKSRRSMAEIFENMPKRDRPKKKKTSMAEIFEKKPKIIRPKKNKALMADIFENQPKRSRAKRSTMAEMFANSMIRKTGVKRKPKKTRRSFAATKNSTRRGEKSKEKVSTKRMTKSCAVCGVCGVCGTQIRVSKFKSPGHVAPRKRKILKKTFSRGSVKNPTLSAAGSLDEANRGGTYRKNVNRSPAARKRAAAARKRATVQLKVFKLSRQMPPNEREVVKYMRFRPNISEKCEVPKIEHGDKDN